MRFSHNIPVALSEVAKSFYDRGWMPGTAGNLSARAEQDYMWITASGKSKGMLTDQDFLKLEINNSEVIERQHESNKPSAETEIHQVIYRLNPDANACFHIHTIDACIATTQLAHDAFLSLPNLEMIKGFDIWEQTPNVALPVFKNHLDVSKIAHSIEKQFSQLQPDITALMIENHGVTVWGNSIEQAFNRVEIIEFIMQYLARQASIKK